MPETHPKFWLEGENPDAQDALGPEQLADMPIDQIVIDYHKVRWIKEGRTGGFDFWRPVDRSEGTMPVVTTPGIVVTTPFVVDPDEQEITVAIINLRAWAELNLFYDLAALMGCLAKYPRIQISDRDEGAMLRYVVAKA